jgi:hypothetical protein
VSSNSLPDKEDGNYQIRFIPSITISCYFEDISKPKAGGQLCQYHSSPYHFSLSSIISISACKAALLQIPGDTCMRRPVLKIVPERDEK